MSLILEAVLERAAEKVLEKFLYNNTDETSGNCYNNSAILGAKIKRRAEKMSWLNFSDKELRIVNEVEKNPGMGGKQIIALMSTYDADYADGQCQEAMTKFLLANLVDRKVLISQGKHGYVLNDSDTPPPCKLPILPPE